MKGVLHAKISAILDEFTYRHRYGLSDGDVRGVVNYEAQFCRFKIKLCIDLCDFTLQIVPKDTSYVMS